jgi:hypothetical protein
MEYAARGLQRRDTANFMVVTTGFLCIDSVAIVLGTSVQKTILERARVLRSPQYR